MHNYHQMNKKISLFIKLFLTASVPIASLFFLNFKNSDFSTKKAFAADSSYSICFDIEDNRISSTGSMTNFIGYTALGNQVSFNYYDVTIASDDNNWVSFSSGGQFGNSDPISGLKSFCIKFSDSNEGKVSLFCGWHSGDSICYPYSYSFDNSNSDIHYGLDDPCDYFILRADSDVLIEYMYFTFSCSSSTIPEEYSTAELTLNYGNSTLFSSSYTRGKYLDLYNIGKTAASSYKGYYYGGVYESTSYDTRYPYACLKYDSTYYIGIFDTKRTLAMYYWWNGSVRVDDTVSNTSSYVIASSNNGIDVTLTGVVLNYHFTINGNTGTFSLKTDSTLFDTSTGKTIPAGTVMQSGTVSLSLSYSTSGNTSRNYKIACSVGSYSTRVTSYYNSSYASNSNSNSALNILLSMFTSDSNALPYNYSLKAADFPFEYIY